MCNQQLTNEQLQAQYAAIAQCYPALNKVLQQTNNVKLQELLADTIYQLQGEQYAIALAQL